MPQPIGSCRLCGNAKLTPLLSLGDQALTGVFPEAADTPVTRGPLKLVRCDGGCGLVQLLHSFESAEMYGDNYGYRSSLNNSMVEHLGEIVSELTGLVRIKEGDVVLDIGSNDGTLLGAFPSDGPLLVGMDPSATKFRKYYRGDIKLIVDFFSAQRFLEASKGRKCKVITSIAMFYDLESPLEFMRQVKEILAEDGIWHFEQSYLATMLEENAYDTICHEHVEYYALRQIEWMLERVGMKLIDVRMNKINGGSFAVTVAHDAAKIPVNDQNILRIRALEKAADLGADETFTRFANRVQKHRGDLLALLRRLKAEGKKVLGYGASTKGNVILQYCGIDESLLPAIAEVNKDKFGHVTPGTENNYAGCQCVRPK